MLMLPVKGRGSDKGHFPQYCHVNNDVHDSSTRNVRNDFFILRFFELLE